MELKDTVYFLPTKLGGYWIATGFVLFLIGVGYSNNICLFFSLLFFSITLLLAIEAHFHMAKFKVKKLFIQSGHAQTNLPFTLEFETYSKLIQLTWQQRIQDQAFSLDEANQYLIDQRGNLSKVLKGEIKVSKRGLLKLQKICLNSSYPFGLWNCRRYIDVSKFLENNNPVFVWPGLNTQPYPLHQKDADQNYIFPLNTLSDEEFEISPADESTPWKRYFWPAISKDQKIWAQKSSPVLSQEKIFEFPSSLISISEESLSSFVTHILHCHKSQIPWKANYFDEKFSDRSSKDELDNLLKLTSLVDLK